MKVVNINSARRGCAVVSQATVPSVPRFQLLQQAFAEKGWRLDPLQGESLLMQCCGATRVLQNLDEAERVIAQMGGI